MICGFVAGLIYVIASLLDVFHGILLGASGGVLGLLVACAVLFPHMQLILFIFPVPIRFAALLFTGLYFYNVIQRGDNAGGDLCHLGGMATGFIWVMGGPYWNKLSQKRSAGAYNRKVEQERSLQAEIDRILSKVNQQGMQSLTRREKLTLKEATHRQQQNQR